MPSYRWYFTSFTLKMVNFHNYLVFPQHYRFLWQIIHQWLTSSYWSRWQLLLWLCKSIRVGLVSPISCTLYAMLPHCICVSEQFTSWFCCIFSCVFCRYTFFMALFMLCHWQVDIIIPPISSCQSTCVLVLWGWTLLIDYGSIECARISADYSSRKPGLHLV